VRYQASRSTIHLNTKWWQMPVVVEQLAKKIADYEQEFGDLVNVISEESEKLIDAAWQVAESFSGSWFGWHSEMYFKDFERPPLGSRFSVEWGAYHGLPPGWRVRSKEEVEAEIERRSGLLFSDLQLRLKALVEVSKQLRDEIVLELLPVLPANSSPQTEILKEIENLDFGNRAQTEFCSAAHQSSPNTSRDANAVYSGRKLPAHIYYESRAVQFAAFCANSKDLCQKARKLLKLIHTFEPTASPAMGVDSSVNGSVLIEALQNRLRTFERLTFGFLAFLLTIIVAVACEYTLHRHGWDWLLSHKNSYAIRALFYSCDFVLLLGFFVRETRKWSFTIAGITMLAQLLALLGGPEK
jgi:hypothetical protein